MDVVRSCAHAEPLFGKLDWAGYYLLLGRMKRG